MASFKRPVPRVFNPDQLKEMRDELDRGGVPHESAAERQKRATDILARNMSESDGEPTSFDPT